MRKIVFTAFSLFLLHFAFAQVDSTAVVAPRTTVKIPAAARVSNDHIMMQLGHTIWTGKPDSISTRGWSRSFNAYLMMDFPFKTNPHFSVALGPGISTENMYFSKTTLNIRDNSGTLRFNDVSDTNNFKKYKLATAFLELPIELRFRVNPDDDRRSLKFALGAKIATLVNAHVKGKELRTRGGSAISDFVQKENSKHFFNRNRLSVTARAGFGHFSLFGFYAVSPLFREGLGPTIRPLTIGLTLSGL